MSLLDFYYATKKAEAAYWGATAATFGSGVTRYAITRNPQTLRYAGQMASFGVRAHVNALRGVASTPLVRGGPLTAGGALARVSGAITAGYVLGAVSGTIISETLFGYENSQRLAELYKSPGRFWDEAIKSAPENMWKVIDHYL